MSSKSEAYKTFTELARPILDDPNFQSMKQYVQHGKVTTYEHCMDVAWTAFCLNRRLHLGVKESELVTACLLHDYYLYDWHTHGDHLHGFHHPAIAADKAKLDFEVSDDVKNAIRTHMWPLTLWDIPNSRIAWLLTISDKICSTNETIFKRGRHENRTDQHQRTGYGTMKKELIIASNNQGKIKEYKDIFEPLGFVVYSQGEKDISLEVEETGTTFEENALLKAQAIYDLTRCSVISDDSGLEVEALNGEPGIYSARYKGLSTEHERRMAVIDGLKDADDRSARFVCCICFIDDSGEHHLFKGIWNGTIAFEEEGTNGFGYDPIFISEDADGKTTASLPISFKETYSHRAKAVKMLMDYLRQEA